jgi:hypothetical protein
MGLDRAVGLITTIRLDEDQKSTHKAKWTSTLPANFFRPANAADPEIGPEIGVEVRPEIGVEVAVEVSVEVRPEIGPKMGVELGREVGLRAGPGTRHCNPPRFPLETGSAATPPSHRPRWPPAFRRRPVGATSLSRTTSTTVVGSARRRSPHDRVTAAPAPSRISAAPCAFSSAAALAPFRASSRPPMAVRGRHHPASRSSGATARAVTMSARGSFPTHSSARARTTVVRARPSAATASDKKAERRASGSTRVTVRSGRATASTIPGKPAPEPTSTTVAPTGTNSVIAAQLSRCRSQIRGASRGPMSPRTTPSVTSSSAYCEASASRPPNSVSAALDNSSGGDSVTATAKHSHRHSKAPRPRRHRAREVAGEVHEARTNDAPDLGRSRASRKAGELRSAARRSGARAQRPRTRSPPRPAR